eukprot:TRINITY_DN2102_c0_g1_i1.p1 TRINITY_DN2102_c0_g1~~TRINITY_DN2102_c0_g1_i1.p1  ORF type:complete len:1927 (+),score=287.17 TRINITY_DN2102_c0_g1_i1:97-5877(+)
MTLSPSSPGQRQRTLLVTAVIAPLALALLTLLALLPGSDWPLTTQRGTSGDVSVADNTRNLASAPFLEIAPLNVSSELGRRAQSTRDRGKDAEFLIRASFGPTRASVDALQALPNHEAWIEQQMALPATSHRAYYRQRASAKNPWRFLHYLHKPTAMRGRCEKGSRWEAFALHRNDRLLTLRISKGRVEVAGHFRTDIDTNYLGNRLPRPSACTNEIPDGRCTSGYFRSWQEPYCRLGGEQWTKNKWCRQMCFDLGLGYDGDDCSQGLPELGDYEGMICFVDERVGGLVKLSVDGKCSPTIKVVNPAVWLRDESKIGHTNLRFTTLAPDVLLLAETALPCSLHNVTNILGKVYREDLRMVLQENTVERPSILYEGVSAPRNRFNELHCRLESGCADDVNGLSVDLNVSTLQKFFELSGRYVYTVTALRTSASPCGRLARWKLLECDKEDCSTTRMSGEDQQRVTESLEAQTGWLRDAFINCQNVPDGAVVSVPSSGYFRHVHIMSHNVYDFTEWVGAHPGGQEQIKQWAGKGFELIFPWHHDMDRFERSTTQGILRLVGRKGDSVEYADLPPTLQTEDIARWMRGGASDEECAELVEICGSPGEVANEPTLGNRFHFLQVPVGHEEYALDGGYMGLPDRGSGRINVWAQIAMRSADQLRQRISWALSQIPVVSTSGVLNFKYKSHTEFLLNYYDIFVRNAFGNYRDVLREVTYNPFMGEYLSFRGSTSLDHNGFFPDENYAREIMQLFSIGLWEMDWSGRLQLDKSGNRIPTYSNTDVMNFARVFTGFLAEPRRTNIEPAFTAGYNFIDPMRMHPKLHDAYPKQKLKGSGFLGDGYPLCKDLPQRAFLSPGAKYIFMGKNDGSASDVLKLRSRSKLFKALCGARSTSGSCTGLRPVTVLKSELPCLREECRVLGVRLVQVLDSIFAFEQPSCVHLFFFYPQRTTDAGSRFSDEREMKCEDPSLPVAGASCCIGCPNVAPSYWQVDCASATINWEVQCQSTSWLKYKFCQQTCWDNGFGYPEEDCSSGVTYREKHITKYRGEQVPFPTAKARCAKAGMEVCKRQVKTSTKKLARVWTPTECDASIAIYADGTIASQADENSKQNRIAVKWLWNRGFPVPGNCPDTCRSEVTSCVCPINIKELTLYSRPPSVGQFRDFMDVGAFPPSTPCSICNRSDGIKVYFDSSGQYNKNTVFEKDGQFRRNLRARVDVANKYFFRNPPTFLVRNAPTAKAAEDEVDSLIDHLVEHVNVPSFIGRRLIQRFGVSNPSSAYLREVARAFIKGSYDGKVYSGAYGDLGATVAAVLLYPEASRISSSISAGSLREPLIKLIHFLRAMEFDDSRDRSVVLGSGIIEQFGQAPFLSPSVFNFYAPDYQPLRMPANTPAPEFQIFTQPNVVDFFNGMMSLIRHRGLTTCSGGFGASIPWLCPQASLMLEEPANMEDTIEELDVLLTGGRLTPYAQSIVKGAVSRASEANHFKAAQEALVLSPEFQMIGSPVLGDLRPKKEAEAEASEPRSYKAMVIVFLLGGCDTFNMLVPLGCSLYDEYARVRKDLRLTTSELLEITTEGQTCRTFGVHHKLPFVRDLYKARQAAFLSNMGGLVAPLTKEQYEAGEPQCAGLFSHRDQQRSAQTLQCQLADESARGFGGKVADALAMGSDAFKTATFSIQGKIDWLKSDHIPASIISETKGVARLSDYSRLKPVISNITAYQYKNVYVEEYVKQVSEAMSSSEGLGQVLASAKLKTRFPTSTLLEKQLRQVALLIGARGERRAERDLFWVEQFGYDMHDNLRNDLRARFFELNNALQKFVDEMKAQGVFDDVVVLMSSEFGRTLSSNGLGNDHAWAGNYFILGGALQGGKVYNEFPKSLDLGSEQDAGNGRLIPKYPWEAVMAPVARWLGVHDSQMAHVFPNLANFDGSGLILSKDTLFRS